MIEGDNDMVDSYGEVIRKSFGETKRGRDLDKMIIKPKSTNRY
jgi:hypothetical protein